MNQAQENALADLIGASTSLSPEVVEDALLKAYRAGLDSQFVPVLIELLNVPWHRKHEDIAHDLQQLKDARAVEALFKAAFERHPYLEYDDNFALARKCVWALADIGSPDAKKRLKDLANCPSDTVAGYANKRLEKWNSELSRKGPSARSV